MRRIYHRFPQRIDLDFEIDRPFPDVLACLWQTHQTHTTAERGGRLVKSTVTIEIAGTPTRFEPVHEYPGYPDEVTESADLRVALRDAVLKPDAKVPLAENVFLLRCNDHGTRTECLVVKEDRMGEMDARDFKQFIQGICR